MGITITKPSKSVEVVTDYAALQQSIGIANSLGDNPSKTSKTALAKAVAAVDDSTLVLALHGLNSSQWNAIVVENTNVVKERVVKDWPQMIKDAIPAMLDKAAWKTKPTPVELASDDLDALLDSLTDSQTQELMVAVQELNTPVTAVPKGVRDLL
jgi:hypothetical protein